MYGSRVGGWAGANPRLMRAAVDWGRDEKIAYLHPNKNAGRDRSRVFWVGEQKEAERGRPRTMSTTLVEGIAYLDLYPKPYALNPKPRC